MFEYSKLKLFLKISTYFLILQTPKIKTTPPPVENSNQHPVLVIRSKILKM